MAPIKTNTVGISPQILDDLKLQQLMDALNNVQVKSANEISLSEITRLVEIVQEYPTWNFEEQVDLIDWIPSLNTIDDIIVYYIRTYPSLLLVAPVDPKEASDDNKNSCIPAQSLQDAESVPSFVTQSLHNILNFLSNLLANSTNKAVFNSVSELTHLLAAKDDDLANLSLRALSHLASPPSLHKQQVPERQQHSSDINNSIYAQNRLLAMARGWGSRGSGLGLYTCVTADDSEFGQAELPVEAGELRFEFFSRIKTAEMEIDGVENVGNKKELISIFLSTSDIVTVPVNSDLLEQVEGHAKKNKRQRTGMEDIQPKGMYTRSTAELFFKCLHLAGGRDRVPEDILFPLLTNIRLARSFHSAQARVVGVENRLLALIAILNAHPSQFILSGYFQAQPEICVELIDLVRPTISSGSMASASRKGALNKFKLIESLACPADIPFTIRNLAVDALTALVARRDGANAGLTGVARQANILNELGVGKGMYMGLLPTLLRFSIASLTNFFTVDMTESEDFHVDDETDSALDLGLTFLEAVRPPLPIEKVQISRALSFIDNVLTLCSAVVSAPSATSALTDCGIIPALLSLVSLGSEPIKTSIDNLNLESFEVEQLLAQCRFISSQAIQIIEGAIVTHNNALSSFHDIKGADVLISRLQMEISELGIQGHQMSRLSLCDNKEICKLVASRRVLLFSIINCLTVVVHQESTSSVPTPTSSTHLRSHALTSAIINVFEQTDSYGGMLAALTCSLLSDVMNNDPHVVNYVHQSGIAKSFFNMLKGERETEGILEPLLPTTPELIMAIPNVISALSLTADGASEVKNINPFPAILKVLFHSKYAMPRSKCLLNEMTAVVGTGLDEVMRHVPTLRPLVIESIVEAMKSVINFGKLLAEREDLTSLSNLQDAPASTLENDRTCLMQYALNLGQMLEQILHTQDHCDAFVERGGLIAILDLFQYLVPPTTQFLANACCLSSPSVSTLAHTTTENSLTVAFRCIAINHDSFKILKIVAASLNSTIYRVEEAQRVLSETFPVLGRMDAIDCFGILDGLPSESIYELRGHSDFRENVKAISEYFRSIVILQWQTNIYATAIKAASQRSHEGSAGWSRSEREWKRELSSTDGRYLISRLAALHCSAILESCRIRSSDEYEKDVRDRYVKLDSSSQSIRYRLRIVCQEGAVVRDGIEIDSCANIGSMEMGEIADAYERCINSSGVMRYRIGRGWVSELTRGHGREPIAEVIDVSTIDSNKVPKPLCSSKPNQEKNRMEYRVSSFRTLGASILARLQASFRELFISISRIVSGGVRSLPIKKTSFDPGTVGAHTQSLLNVMASSISSAINKENVVSVLNQGSSNTNIINEGGVAMYLGALISTISSSLFEDKRERRSVNVALLLAIMDFEDSSRSNSSVSTLGGNGSESWTTNSRGIFDAIKFIFEHALNSTAIMKIIGKKRQKQDPVLSLSPVSAASLPPTIAILRRLMAGLPIKQSPLMSVLDKIELHDLAYLVGRSKDDLSNTYYCQSDQKKMKFSGDRFVRSIYLAVSNVVINVWKDNRFRYMPPQIVHPISTLSIEILRGIEDLAKQSATNKSDISSYLGQAGRVSSAHTDNSDAPIEAEETFQSSEEVLSQLMDLGFSRDHAVDALENTESNSFELVMEYALNHPPPSPATVERRRRERQDTQQNIQQAPNELSEGQFDDAVEGSENANTDTSKIESRIEEQENNVEKKVIPSNEEYESKMLMTLTSNLDEWVKDCPITAVQFLAEYKGSTSEVEGGKGDAESEAVSVVISSFLINVCQTHPKVCDNISREILLKLKESLIKVESKDLGVHRESESSNEVDITTEVANTSYSVKEGSERSFAVLCHSFVLLSRAIPSVRLKVLELGMLSPLISCIETLQSTIEDKDKRNTENIWPIWLAPIILMLDALAQPLVLPFDNEDEEKIHEPAVKIERELQLVKDEHRRKSCLLSRMTTTLFSSIARNEDDGKADSILSNPSNANSSNLIVSSLETNGDAEANANLFLKMPFYFPLIPDVMAISLLKLSLWLLGQGSYPPKSGLNLTPGCVHATLQLITRLLRSRHVANESFSQGVVELLLGLRYECRFKDNSGVVTTLLRRLLEDETNLTISMESEIRMIFNRMQKKQARERTEGTASSMSFKPFLHALAPLIHRNQWIFFKALALTVSLFPKSKTDKDTVSLLTPTERQKMANALSQIKFQRNPVDYPIDFVKGDDIDRLSKGKSIECPSSSRKSSNRKSKKEKPEMGSYGTPANHVMSLLLEKLLLLSDENSMSTKNEPYLFGQNLSFLLVADILHIISDLVLAIPACAAALIRYRGSSFKSLQLSNSLKLSHAITGCPFISFTIPNFLLHKLLPLERCISHSNLVTGVNAQDNDKLKESRNRELYVQTKVVQAAARLLAMLVARGGEARKRVLSDLSIALSFGPSDPNENHSIDSRIMPFQLLANDDCSLAALQAWGDLCIGLAAPRSIGGVNLDSISHLSVDIVKLMLDCKMAHSLLCAIRSMDLNHPMAGRACTALLIPLEVFCRSSVTNAVQMAAEKESINLGNQTQTAEGSSEGQEQSMSQGRQTAANDRASTLDSAFADPNDFYTRMTSNELDINRQDQNMFDAESGLIDGNVNLLNNDVQMDHGAEEVDSNDDNDVIEIESLQSDDSDMDDDDDGDDDDDDDDDDDEDEDDDENDVDVDDDDDGVDAEDDSSNPEDDDENDEVEEESDSQEDDEHPELDEMEDFDEIENDDDQEPNLFYIGEGDEGVDDEERRDDNDLDDWHQIEAPPNGGLMLSGRRRRGNFSSRGFTDAAEAVIGTLLRTGEIHNDALAEIEGTLGIRISGNRTLPDWMGRGRSIFGALIEGREAQRLNLAGIVNNISGSIPQLNQRRPPDISQAGSGNVGRWNDVSSIEFIYGGPTLTGRSRNFDVFTERQARDDNVAHSIPSSYDSHLFPGGPAASTHSLTQPPLHPLICGIDLPPVNSLISDLQSHEERSAQVSQPNSRQRAGWDSLSFGATASGYRISSSRSNVLRISQERGLSSNFSGWTDDGQPLDNSILAHGTAFESAIVGAIQSLEESIRQENHQEIQETLTEGANPAQGAMNRNQLFSFGNIEDNISNPANSDIVMSPTAASSNEEGPSSNSNDSMILSEHTLREEERIGLNSENIDLNALTHTAANNDDDIVRNQMLAMEVENVQNDEISHEAINLYAGSIDETGIREFGDIEPTATQSEATRDCITLNLDLPGSDTEVLSPQNDATNNVESQDENFRRRERFIYNPMLNSDGDNEPNCYGFTCPQGMDREVFDSLPEDMQREVVEQHVATMEVVSQLDANSSLDPETLAALPEDMRREILAHDQEQRRQNSTSQADPSNAEEMDNANFVASLAPELRREILMTADESFLSSLPPDVIAEAQILRERASHQQRNFLDPILGEPGDIVPPNRNTAEIQLDSGTPIESNQRKLRQGKMKLDCDRSQVVYLSKVDLNFPTEPFGAAELRSLIKIMFLLSPIRPQRLYQKLFQSLCINASLRYVLLHSFTRILNDDCNGTYAATTYLDSINQNQKSLEYDSSFPPRALIGSTAQIFSDGRNKPDEFLSRRRQGIYVAASIAASLPTTVKESHGLSQIPPIVASRVIDTLTFLCKNSPRVCLDALVNPIVSNQIDEERGSESCFEQILDLLQKPLYTKSASNLEHLLTLLETLTMPLNCLSVSEDGKDLEISEKDINTAAAVGKEWIDIPTIAVSKPRLKLLCSVLRMESCREAAFTKVNGIASHLCKVSENRDQILLELASVAKGLGEDAKRDLHSLLIRMNDAVATRKKEQNGSQEKHFLTYENRAVTFSNSTSEIKLLRVLQTLQSLCGKRRMIDTTDYDLDANEFTAVLQSVDLKELWGQLSACLKVVRILEGISTEGEIDCVTGISAESRIEIENLHLDAIDEGSYSALESGGMKLQNSSAGLLSRFLPVIEAFFAMNASTMKKTPALGENPISSEKEDYSVSRSAAFAPETVFLEFVSENKVILNALVRSNPSLLEKGLRAMVQSSSCRNFLDFDVKRQWFKGQIKRLRQQASRRHGSLRLSIRRKHVFEDAYHQLRLRNADEMRSRLHVTFRNEEGVDAGGLSREFFGILAKEIFNPNYALFMSTEDGCTFQPNPNSSINPDHLSYFRFVGRIVGKAVADGFLLDAHFTRSLYKHMLGIEPTHHDMEAIDPDYYKNLKMILEYSLEDIGLELSFSISDMSFGRSQVIDLIPNGRNVPVTDENKSRYVSLVCKHRMTNSIKSQIQAYLDGFYELVSPDLISIFSPRELELLISGLPDIDISDLKNNTDYHGWKATDPEIEWFWKIMSSFSRSEKASFLQFVTGSSKVPLAGFADLQGMRGIQKFSIHKANGSAGALVSAHTCFNSLDLPKYDTEEEMKEKLLYAINEGQGSFLFA